MARSSPLQQLHRQAEATLLQYGPGEGEETVRLVETYGELELEYGALRKSCVLMDQPQRGLIEITGKDRLEFLNRMVTQELKGLGPFRVKRSFWLNRKGRIDSDMRIIDLPRRTLLEMDVHAVARTIQGLSEFVVIEDVVMQDITERTHRLAVHGPTAFDLIKPLAAFAGGAEASGPAFEELRADRACVIRIGDAEVTIFRDDSTGEVGLELIVGVEHAPKLYQQFIEFGTDHDGEHGAATPARTWGHKIKLRPAGWHAFNIARIEAGRPLYNLDFGVNSLPAETGVMSDRVSMTKGCYLGQEIVARMHSRGHPKQQLVLLKFDAERDPATGFPRQPVSGAHVHAIETAEVVGAITSSTVSPMLGAVPIAFAQLKWEYVQSGMVLFATAEGGPVKGVVQPGLQAWKKPEGFAAP